MKEQVLNAMRAAGKPVSAGEVTTALGADRKKALSSLPSVANGLPPTKRLQQQVTKKLQLQIAAIPNHNRECASKNDTFSIFFAIYFCIACNIAVIYQPFTLL